MKLLLLSLLSLVIIGCKDEETTTSPTTSASVTVTDDQLAILAQQSAGQVYYKNSSAVLNTADASGHSEKTLRTRYNAKAATQLDANGKVKASPVFPDSSLITKELYNTDGTVAKYAIMFKLRGAKNADAAGWVWGYVTNTGSVVAPSSSKGAGCTGCHASAFDFTRMNDTHP